MVRRAAAWWFFFLGDATSPLALVSLTPELGWTRVLSRGWDCITGVKESNGGGDVDGMILFEFIANSKAVCVCV